MTLCNISTIKFIDLDLQILQAQIEDFIAKVYKSRNNEDIDKKLTSTIFSLVVCAFLVGGMIGGLSGGLVAEKFGRKNGLLYTQSLSLIGAILSGCSRPAQAYEMLIIGRLMIGVACGLFTGTERARYDHPLE